MTVRLLVLAAALAALTTPAAAEDLRRTVVRDGVPRAYSVVDPDPKSGPGPVVFILHGGGGDAARMRRLGFEAAGTDAGLVTVYPEGRGGGWRDGRQDGVVAERSGEVDDVGFLVAVMDELIAEGRADPRRIYVVGASNGGMMALRLACERPDRLAAVVAVIALLPAELEKSCRMPEPLPIMLMVGTDDKFVPLAGGPVAGFLNQDRGTVISLDRTLAVLLPRLGCSGEPSRAALTDKSPGDGVTTERLDWADCRGRGRLALMKMQGAGHGWPGKAVPARGIRLDEFRGATTLDFDGAAVAWEFLAPARRP
ncbi:alpha/beta fold hydrolase [Caulobacter sp. SLTY]|uniref:alpha/beta hydrolase family esterase n=1 Tax=Caulobacter sp. SLTY TaxID=2683262 RepID=UPI0014131FA4|nr:prolyl oligopeptidase family serine peptidase [Caulobacter sp. SLTY]NBB16826.1 alpha/beta fold hydrolase [Caulobacter sp. SLTY]